ncbi:MULTISPECIES: hypothetical protein [Actinomyces]|uniref:Uncharacterized protein n=1 Tax=Actinomyces respiraculi TaxID=2744574 RepID=A0A7T0LKU9_9ACTO|nr:MULTISPECIES: hypothetical protein [Actinomyces]QPL05013.1 hypothetical protein ID810_09730 [Actinomyces respiraculi]
MTTTNWQNEREPRGRSTPVILGVGWAASLVGYLLVRVAITAVGPGAGLVNFALVLMLPALSALGATLAVPPAWLQGATGALRHALVVIPVPLVFTIVAIVSSPTQWMTGRLIVTMSVVMLLGVLAGGLLGRLLRRDPDRTFSSS